MIRASEWAKDHGLRVVGLTGFDGGRLKDLAHVHIHVPSDDYGMVEDLHLALGHIVSKILRTQVLADSATVPLT